MDPRLALGRTEDDGGGLVVTLDPKLLNDYAFCQVISAEPLVMLAGWHLDMKPVTEQLAAIGVRDATIILSNWWSVEAMTVVTAERFKTYFERLAATRAAQNFRIVFFTNTPAEATILSELGYEAHFVTKFCLADETRFQVSDAAAEFDAVYNGQMAAFKRHELARDVHSLLLIYGLFDEAGPARFNEVKAMLPRAVFANGDPFAPPDSPHAYRRFGPEELCAQYARARCSLALSSIEGTMLSGVESLLCGLPIVSTLSRGGRELFFSPDHSLIVRATPEAVAEGVRDFVARRADRAGARQATLALIRKHRAAFAEALHGVLASAGRPVDKETARTLTRRLAHEAWYGLELRHLGGLLGLPGFAKVPVMLA